MEQERNTRNECIVPSTKNRNEFLNIIEAIAAYSVVLLHCQFPGVIGEIIRCYGAFAVPMFFAISGFFYYKENIVDSLKTTKHKIKRLIFLVLITELFYFLWACIPWIKSYGLDFRCICENVICVYIHEYDIRRLFSLGPIFHQASWFMVWLFVTYAVWHVLLKCRMEKIAYIFIPIGIISISTILYIRSILGYEPIWYIHMFFLFSSFPYFSLGYYLHKNVNNSFVKKKYSGIFMVLIGGLFRL